MCGFCSASDTCSFRHEIYTPRPWTIMPVNILANFFLTFFSSSCVIGAIFLTSFTFLVSEGPNVVLTVFSGKSNDD